MTEDDETCPRCSSDLKEEESYYICTSCDWWNLKQEDEGFLNVVGVWIVGHDAYPVALFRYPEQAEEWGRENFFGQWLTKVIQVPAVPLFTEEEWEKAREKAEELSTFFKDLPEAE